MTPTAHRTGRHVAWALARLLWVSAMLAALVSVATGTPRRYVQLGTVTPIAVTTMGQLLPADAERMTQSGLSVEAYAGYFTTVEILTALVSLAVAALIFVGRSHEWMALVVSLNLMAGAVVLPLVSALEATHPLWSAIILGWRMAFAGSLVSLLVLFPNGRFVPRWTRWLTLVWLGYILLWPWAPRIRLPFGFGDGLGLADLPTFLAAVAVLLIGVAAQIWRYRRVSTPLERQRTKWVVFGFGLLLLGIVIGVTTYTYLTSAPTGAAFLMAQLAGPTMILLGFQAMALTVGVSVLRYHLWDIDFIIRRALIYSVLTAALALAYLSSIIVLQAVFGALTGENRNELVTVISTLTIAALFVPLRGRVQRTIDRRFYRRKYDSARTLAAFGAQARDVVELEQLAGQLVRAVDETMQPAHVGLWVRGLARPEAGR